jgi:YbgC/YbaW family acyl-CoA thioester hydrolase
MYRFRRRVQFYETDAAGIVHFSWYPRYMEEAEHALWRAAGLSIAQPAPGIGWPRVAVSFEFYRPLRFEDEFDISIRITAIEAKRIHYACTLERGEIQLAAGKMTIACVSRGPDGSMRSMPIPKDIAERFEVANLEDWDVR